VITVLKKWARAHSIDEIFELAQLMRFPWAPVRTPNEVLKSPQLKARQFFIEKENVGLGETVSAPGSPYKMSSKTDTRFRPAPWPGEHNELIYRQELGLSKQNLKRLHDRNVI
jgi:crotonobetainyl-CoA:carnitine CoA-transferase CaiB-like acyl-CoA transferase